MNYAAGQMASIVRLVNTDPNWPVSRTVRTVPLLQRGAWRPWPWRLWGGPSLAYGRSLADYPAMQPYTFENYPPYLDPYYPEAYYPEPYPYYPEPYPYDPEPYPYDPYADPYEGYYGYPGYDVGQASSALSAAAQTLIASIQANASHSQPPAWKPTIDFQTAFNHGLGPLGGLGTQARPELLKVDGIYGKRTEMALAKVVGGLDKLMSNVYGGPSAPAMPPSSPPPHGPEAAAGYGTGQQLDIVGPSIHRYRASGPAPHQYDILAGTTINPQLGAAVRQLGDMLMGRPGIVAVADAQNAIDVFVLQQYVPTIRAYIDNVLMGNFMGFPVTLRPSAPIVLQ
jgi:hypothetical protein